MATITLGGGTPLLSYHVPIIQVQNKANTTPFTYAQNELNGQTFVNGAPVMVDPTTGLMKVWDGTFTSGSPGVIAGISETAGQNLPGTPPIAPPVPPWGQIQGVGAIQSYGTVPNQPNAVNIALGTPVADGRTLFMSPAQDNVYEAMVDNSAYTVGNTSLIIPVQADIGKLFGLNREPTGANPNGGGNYSGGQWYVDRNMVTVNTNTVVQIVGINPNDGNGTGGYIPNARVRFVIWTAAAAPGY